MTTCAGAGRTPHVRRRPLGESRRRRTNAASSPARRSQSCRPASGRQVDRRILFRPPAHHVRPLWPVVFGRREAPSRCRWTAADGQMRPGDRRAGKSAVRVTRTTWCNLLAPATHGAEGVGAKKRSLRPRGGQGLRFFSATGTHLLEAPAPGAVSCNSGQI